MTHSQKGCGSGKKSIKKKLKKFIRSKTKKANAPPAAPVRTIQPQTLKDVAAQVLGSNQAYATRKIGSLAGKFPVPGNSGSIPFTNPAQQAVAAARAVTDPSSDQRQKLNELQVQYALELDRSNRKTAREDQLRQETIRREDEIFDRNRHLEIDKEKAAANIQFQRELAAATEKKEQRAFERQKEATREQERIEDRKIALEERRITSNYTYQQKLFEMNKLAAEFRNSELKFLRDMSKEDKEYERSVALAKQVREDKLAEITANAAVRKEEFERKNLESDRVFTRLENQDKFQAEEAKAKREDEDARTKKLSEIEKEKRAAQLIYEKEIFQIKSDMQKAERDADALRAYNLSLEKAKIDAAHALQRAELDHRSFQARAEIQNTAADLEARRKVGLKYADAEIDVARQQQLNANSQQQSSAEAIAQQALAAMQQQITQQQQLILAQQQQQQQQTRLLQQMQAQPQAAPVQQQLAFNPPPPPPGPPQTDVDMGIADSGDASTRLAQDRERRKAQLDAEAASAPAWAGRAAKVEKPVAKPAEKSASLQAEMASQVAAIARRRVKQTPEQLQARIDAYAKEKADRDVAERSKEEEALAAASALKPKFLRGRPAVAQSTAPAFNEGATSSKKMNQEAPAQVPSQAQAPAQAQAQAPAQSRDLAIVQQPQQQQVYELAPIGAPRFSGFKHDLVESYTDEPGSNSNPDGIVSMGVQRIIPEPKAKRRDVAGASERLEDDAGVEKAGEGKAENEDKGLSDKEIDEIMEEKVSEAASDSFRGVYSYDELDEIEDLPLDEPSSLVINLDRSSGPGTHWVALWIDPRPKTRSVEYFDSFGEEPPKRLAEKIQQLAKNNFDDLPELLKFKTNGVKRQSVSSPNCGFFAIEFISKRADGIPFNEATGYKQASLVSEGEEKIRKVRHNFGFI